MAARHSIVTVTGRNKEAAQKAANLPVRFTEIALGSGNRYPAGGETTLQAEVHRGQITGSGVMAGEPNAVWFDLYVAADVATFYAQEIGLFDEDGVLYALSRFDQPVPKFGPDSASLSDNTFRIVVVFSDTENVVVETSPVTGLTPETLSQHLPWAQDKHFADPANETNIPRIRQIHEEFGPQSDALIAGFARVTEILTHQVVLDNRQRRLMGLNTGGTSL
ncbi:putative phage tail Collar [Roseibium sp. TrichSKD4]|uniref:phage tail-collar fiber domain-containing protein n=1 Tax=Roseibium sp. TrichSKD4 TaxID=744980 RepID=UPI0001E575FB|nr:phage tail protein [Roseibium sp. TrichSKD4]EFO30930.1 putative phage tail Collar [Roseibium sp. TrichSKD4]